ncbi:hypothetical protein KDW41_00750 [Burkholderia vietnamiensis]|nr:hypothetical protein [Burkholderia vietnamiensis]
MNPIPDDRLAFRIGARPVRSTRLEGGILATQVGSEPPAVVVLNGGQAFVAKTTLRRLRRDVRRVARILPAGTPFVLLGYPDAPGTQYRIADIAEQIARGIAAHWKCTTLMGISFGGIVAARLAASTRRSFPDSRWSRVRIACPLEAAGSSNSRSSTRLAPIT